MGHEFMRGDGLYEVEVENAFVKETRRLGTVFVVEFRIVKSFNLDEPEGAQRAWCHRMRTAAAVHMLDHVWAEEVREMQLAELERFFTKGRNILLSVRTRHTRREGRSFVQHTWRELGANLSQEATA